MQSGTDTLTAAASSCCSLNVDAAVRDRYAAAAHAAEPALCCPVSYNPHYLAAIPQEIIERDYGCGDPSRYVRSGETVLDLGSGGGKICYIAAQVVGPRGRVIGVDCNNEMLGLARKHLTGMAEQLGYANVEFRKGKIQDLQLDLDRLDVYLQEHPCQTSTDWLLAEEHAAEMRKSAPLIPTESIDVVVSNCVLNLVRQADRQQLFAEIYRVLKRGGRAVISDIVSDEAIPEALSNDPVLWSGCLSGAYREDRFLEAFEAAGFHGIEILERQAEPWQVVRGIEFRSLTVQVFKGKSGPCLERHQAVIYNGPWKSVTDDDGHTLLRGQRMAVCDKTFQIYTQAPYAEDISPVPPRQLIPLDAAKPMSCNGAPVRDPQETKATVSPAVGGIGLDLLPVAPCCGTTDCC